MAKGFQNLKVKKNSLTWAGSGCEWKWAGAVELLEESIVRCSTKTFNSYLTFRLNTVQQLRMLLPFLALHVTGTSS